MNKIPAAWYGPEHNSPLDPDRFTPDERRRLSTTRLKAEHQRRTSPSPVIRAFQAATDKALGRRSR